MRGSSLGLHAGGKNYVPSLSVSCGRILEIVVGLLGLLTRTPQALASWVIGGGVCTHPLQDILIARGQGGRGAVSSGRSGELAEGRSQGPRPAALAPAPRTRLRAARNRGFPTRAKGSAEGTAGGALPARERWTAVHWLPSLRPRSPLATARAHGPSTLPRAAQRVACQGGAANGSARGAGLRTPGAPARASR